jgi:hypothetical protein
VKGKITQWDTWIAQAKQDATESKKQMMLIFKYNSVDVVVGLGAKLEDKHPFMIYDGGTYMYKLSDLLLQPDEFFFG